MKITAITTHVINMPLKLDGDVPHVGGQARTALEMLLVRVDTDAGVTGWGAPSRSQIEHFPHFAHATELGDTGLLDRAFLL
jgi:L-alanine-DL-glutamate epimerase-like enolase superfamily enzyme